MVKLQLAIVGFDVFFSSKNESLLFLLQMFILGAKELTKPKFKTGKYCTTKGEFLFSLKCRFR